MNYINTKIKENPKDPEKIIGKRFHDLTPIEFLGYRKISEDRPEKGYFYRCRCECGRFRITISHRLKTGTVQHCKNCKNKKLKEYHDAIGKTFNHLTIKEIYRDSKNLYKIIALCDCDCGRKNKKIRLANILSGMSQSCGCLNKREPVIIHGLSNKPFYSILLGINYRCKNPKNYHYFQKGITVCKDWDLMSIPKRKKDQPIDIESIINHNIHNYNNFESWYYEELKKLNLSPEEAKRQKYSIDRINNYGPYSPENCRLATLNQQLSNRGREKKVFYKNYKFSFSEISMISGIPLKKLLILLKEFNFNKDENENFFKSEPEIERALELLYLLKTRQIAPLNYTEINDILNKYQIEKDTIDKKLSYNLFQYTCIFDCFDEKRYSISTNELSSIKYVKPLFQIYTKTINRNLLYFSTIYLFYCNHCKKYFLVENLDEIQFLNQCPSCTINIDKQKQLIRGIGKSLNENNLGLGYKHIFKRKSTLRRFFELEETSFEHICYMYNNDIIRIFNEHPYGKEWKRKLDVEILNPDSDLYKIHPREVVFYRYQNLVTSAKVWARILGVNESTFNVQINRVLNSGKTFQYLIEVKHPEYKETIEIKLKDPETIEQLRQNPYVQFIEDEDYVVNTYPKSWARLLDLGFNLFIDFSDRLYVSKPHWKISNNSIKNTVVSPYGKKYYTFN